MKKIALADLTHVYDSKPLNISFPLGISFIASYAKEKLSDIEVNLFKYPQDFTNFLKSDTPDIVGFSNMSWTLEISHEFAKQIKKHSPQTITVAGGPNYPLEAHKQERFLLDYPYFDFYIHDEGEPAFVKLYQKLEEFGFNVEEFKKNRIQIGNCDYIHEGKIIRGETLQRIENLDDVSSPYLSGMMDNFFDGILIPVIETTRGCPFSCTYCQMGKDYFNKVRKFSTERLTRELEYIAKKVEVSNLIIADANFAMYKDDFDICEAIASIQKKYNWPNYIETALGKNKKKVLEAIALLKDSIPLSASVQSTNEIVLKNIRRKNISLEETLEIAQRKDVAEANSFSEIILCLPGDTKEAHFKSMTDMIDIGINIVRSHQLLMLPGSEISTDRSREKYGMVTRFRIQPRCFGEYEAYGEKFPAFEIDEICVANNTMSYKDYLRCREFDLSVEIFHNNGIFRELEKFLEQKGIATSSFVKEIDEKVLDSSLKELYNNYLRENEGALWESLPALQQHVKQPGMIEKYVEEELRNNEQLKYRAIAFFTKMKKLHDMAFDSAKEILKEKGILDENIILYLNELKEFSLLRKNLLFEVEKVEGKKFNYDFVALLKNNFEDNPFSYIKSTEIKFFHSPEQKKLISGYIKQYGTSMNGLGFILSRSHANKFYREIKQA